MMSATLKIDFHTHSEGSYDGKEPVELMLDHIEDEDIELDGFAVTDHDEIEQSLEAEELAENKNTLVIPGVEVSTADGHLLAIGVRERPEEQKPFMETVKEIREMGGAAVVPHPFQKTRHGVSKRKINDIDAVEAFNAWLFTGFQNRRAKKFAENHDYPKVAGSDAHSLGMIGRAYTEIEINKEKEQITSQDVVEAIREGETTMNGVRAPIYRAAYHYFKASIRKIAYYSSKFLEKINEELYRYNRPLRELKNRGLGTS